MLTKSSFGIAFPLVSFVLLLLLVACAPPSNSEPPKRSASDAQLLEGTLWVAESYIDAQGELVAPLADAKLTLEFNGGQIAGNAGCNRFGGTYVLDGDSLTIEIGPLTMMACAEPVMEQENAYLAALGQVAAYAVEDDRLTLTNAEGAIVARFVVASPLALTEVSWQLISYNNNKGGLVSSRATELITAQFGEDGKLTGFAGCNNYSAEYEVDGDSIKIGPAASTRKMCAEPEGVMEDEAGYLAALARVATFEIKGDELTMYDAEGTRTLVFRAALQAEADNEAVGASAPSVITGITWEWVAFQDQADENNIEVDEPGKYTLLLNDDGSYAVQADCNQGKGEYALQGAELQFQPGPITRAACGEDSLDQFFLQRLSEVVSYVVEDGKLFLNLKADAGNMVFRKADSQSKAGETVQGLDIEPDQISLDALGLPLSWVPVIVPAQPYTKTDAAVPYGMPEHIEILFGVTDPAERQPNDPIMYIIPVKAYQKMWEDAGNEGIIRNMVGVASLSYQLPSPPPTSGYPGMPPEEGIVGFNDVAVHVGRAESAENSAVKNGFRFVGRWASEPTPVTNADMRYVFQGYTNDGEYLVAFFYPVSTDALPDSPDAISQDDLALFNSDPITQTMQVAETLNGLDASDWRPDLTTLDKVVGSLQIEGMASNGLVGRTWQWLGTVAGADGEVRTRVADPASYTLMFGEDGAYQFIADCNSGQGEYDVEGGIIGAVTMRSGPATLAECGEDSLSQEMILSFESVTSYRMLPGAEFLELVMPAEGAVTVWRAQ
ncbi:MAG: META domain-containing protein [Chloroflexi bacterium]|nr:META domain-containing protein [Chloroflexota bacterium]